MAMPGPETEIGDLNNLFIRLETEMEKSIRKYMMSYEAPFWAQRAITDFNFSLGQGYIKNVWTAHGSPAPQQARSELWTLIRKSGLDGGYNKPSDHSGADDCPVPTFDADHNACVPDPKARISWGFERKEYQPYISVLDTDTFCLKDLQHDWEIEQQVSHIMGNLRDAITGHGENWNRDTYASFCRIFPAIPGFQAHEGAALGEIPHANLNFGVLTQRLLDELYELLCGEYADKAIGMDNNMPVFGLITSNRDSEGIVLSDPSYRTDLRYLQSPDLMKRFGSGKLFRNYLHMFDPRIPRYVADAAEPSGLRRVYMWLESATTKGVKKTTNPEYLNAPYALTMVYMKDVFSNGKLAYKDSVGEIGGQGVDMLREAELHWLNYKTDDNPLGQMGKYLVEFTRAPRPGVKTGFAFIHRRAGFQTDFRYNTDGFGPSVNNAGVALSDNVVSAVQDSATEITITLTGAISGVSAGDLVTVYFGDTHRLNAEVTLVAGADLSVTFGTVADPVEVAITDHSSVYAVQAV